MIERGEAGEPARLVSVNVGLPRNVTWRGRTVHTGIWKSPVDGPCLVRRLNLDGDGQGDLNGHGGVHRAVYVYQLGSYDHWAEELGRDDFVCGQFGENFTVAGMPDDEVCIGDRYRIGTALFEVSQPRVTCYRVGIRMDEPRMPALLTGGGRPGFYLRVLEKGTVEAGQDITKVADGPEGMTVAEANALLYRSRHPRAALERALRIAALSPGWRASFQALLDAPTGSGNAGLTTATPRPPAWEGFRAARVVERRRESAAVWSYVLDSGLPAAGSTETPAVADAPLALPGQFTIVRLRSDTDSPPVLRSYSLSGPPAYGRLQISVKREEFGRGSRLLVDHYGVGDTIEVAAPRGSFVLRPGDGPVALTSAGIGATPVLAMLHDLVAGDSRREVWWLHGARRRAEHSFATVTDALLAQLPNAHRHVCYSRPDPGDRIGVDYDARGHLSADMVAELGVPQDAEYYLCGPSAFQQELVTGLVADGVSSRQIFTEVFGARAGSEPGVVPGGAPRPPHQPATTPATGPAVSFSRSDVSTSFTPAYASLLELAEACDVPVRWACRTGVCHTCETDLLSGAVTYDPEPIDPPGDGKVLICCSRPAAEVVLDL